MQGTGRAQSHHSRASLSKLYSSGLMDHSIENSFPMIPCLLQFSDTRCPISGWDPSPFCWGEEDVLSLIQENIWKSHWLPSLWVFWTSYLNSEIRPMGKLPSEFSIKGWELFQILITESLFTMRWVSSFGISVVSSYLLLCWHSFSTESRRRETIAVWFPLDECREVGICGKYKLTKKRGGKEKKKSSWLFWESGVSFWKIFCPRAKVIGGFLNGARDGWLVVFCLI